jgi:hypothetical protein
LDADWKKRNFEDVAGWCSFCLLTPARLTSLFCLPASWLGRMPVETAPNCYAGWMLSAIFHCQSCLSTPSTHWSPLGHRFSQYRWNSVTYAINAFGMSLA